MPSDTAAQPSDPAPGSALPERSEKRPKRRDAARARAELLDVATAEFARVGYYGARVDEIAAQSSTTKRMIYYYFGDKDGLFTAVLERSYADIRAAERALDLSALPPLDAVAALVEHTLRWHAEHPELARLVSAENSLDATHLRSSTRQAGANLPILELIEDILRRGRADGSIVRDVAALDLHLQMSAVALFRVTNAPTIEATFGERMTTPESLDRAIATMTSMIRTWLATPAASE
ncbi:MAG: TetR/AcrR family transcriptional regulator [Micropruina sp.]|uniref:TetR/AcrR family transcriptional regulator n=1 Tax=Micropruina sp. TaxID=2737536 RepID=UPI0039E5A41C